MKWVSALLLLPLLTGCVTVAEFRKLENEVTDMKRARSRGGAGSNERIAELAARLAALESENERLGGRVEVAEHRAQEALDEARTARQEAASAPVSDSNVPTSMASDPLPTDNLQVSKEVAAYRAGYSDWRQGDWAGCIDRFHEFLQTYPSSTYADDAAYLLADSYFKQGDYKTAILRFDDVVTTYPDGPKAADALFRQGEALMQLGPNFNKAASKAFERVVTEFPQSARAADAKRQLQLLSTR